MKVLVTGANGLLGQKLITLLARKGTPYLATSLGPSRLDLGDAPYQSLDVTDREPVLNTVRDFRPNVIIHCAAMTQVDRCETERERCWQLNVTAVENILQAASECSAHLIHLSTDFIFDGKAGPYNEEAEPHPVNYYGETKLAAEQLIKGSDARWSIVRTVLVYGVNRGTSRSNIVLWIKESLEAGKSIEVVDDQYRTPTLAEDLAEGCLLVAEQGAPGVFHISGKDLLTPYDMACITAEFLKMDRSLIKRTDSKRFTQPAARPLKTGFIIKKARKLLGYEPRSFEEGLKIMARSW